MMIDNVDARSADYPKDAPYRPGHADFTYDAKYGFRDPRGGGRASARETAMRVAGGAVARLVIPEVEIAAAVVEIGGEADESRWEAMLDEARAAGDSLGAVVECVATGVPAGWGAPVYAKLDAELAAACMGINAVKGVEIGEGFAAGAAEGQRECRCDARRQVERHRRRAFRPAGRSSSGSRSSRRRASAARAATTPASAFAARRWSRRWSRWCWPITSCCTGANADRLCG